MNYLIGTLFTVQAWFIVVESIKIQKIMDRRIIVSFHFVRRRT